MPAKDEIYYGEAPPEFRQTTKEHYELADQFISYRPENFDIPKDGVLKRLKGYIGNIDHFEYKISAAGIVGGFLLSASALLLVDRASEAAQNDTPVVDEDKPSVAPSSLPPETQLPPLGPEFEIDLTEIAVAHAAMVDFSLEKMNHDGALETVPAGVGGGGLFIDNSGLYFATAANLLEPADNETEEEFYARFVVPVGVGYDPLQFVVPLDKFELLDENPEVVRTPVVDLDNSLLVAIKDERIIPLQATTMLGTFGKTVIGAATQETPFLDTQTGIVLSRTIRQYNQSGFDTGFMSDEVSCNEDVQIGDFVLLQDSVVPSAGRLTPLAYGVITGTQTQADPHNTEACITDGTLSINRELEIHTF